LESKETTGYFKKRNTTGRDRDGDVIMTGAKVARKQGLCFNCGKMGQSKNKE
jgi:hypothetical protein